MNDDLSFVDHEFRSSKMRRYKTSKMVLHPYRLPNISTSNTSDETDCSSMNSLLSRQMCHHPSDVFPAWMLAREDFRNLDVVIRERRLTQALESSPYMRNADETNVLATFVTESWSTAAVLGPERVFQLAKCVAYSTYARGDYILEEGQDSRSFYIIVKGSVEVVRTGGLVAILPSGGCFGENAVSNGGVTNASCIAHTETVGVLILTKTDYDNIMTDILFQEKADATQILKRVPMFKGWGRTRIDCVVRLVRRNRRLAGEVIVKQGDPPSNVYFILEGKVEVTRNVPILRHNTWPTGPKSWKRVDRASLLPVKLSELERGSFFGEKAIVEGRPSSSTAKALVDAVFLSLDKNDFMSLLEQFHKLDEIKEMIARVYLSDKELISRHAEATTIRRLDQQRLPQVR